jgi:hypothetical protein
MYQITFIDISKSIPSKRSVSFASRVPRVNQFIVALTKASRQSSMHHSTSHGSWSLSISTAIIYKGLPTLITQDRSLEWRTLDAFEQTSHGISSCRQILQRHCTQRVILSPLSGFQFSWAFLLMTTYTVLQRVFYIIFIILLHRRPINIQHS